MAKASKHKTINANVEIISRIHFVRGQKVMLDFDLAHLYEVETRRLNEQVKRNTIRFPDEFMFRLTEKEWNLMRSQYATSSLQIVDNKKDINMMSQKATLSQAKRKATSLPFAFTEHGITMAAKRAYKRTSYKDEYCCSKSIHRIEKIFFAIQRTI